jgi:hypothetical protein
VATNDNIYANLKELNYWKVWNMREKEKTGIYNERIE